MAAGTALDPVVVLERWGCVADGASLRLACGEARLRRAVAEGRVLRLARNSYALPGADGALEAAVRLRGTVSHLPAARAWGWKVKQPPGAPVVTVPRQRRVAPHRREGVEVRWADLAADEVEGRCTSRERTVVDCARTLPFDEALCVADSALREGRVSRTDLRAAAERSPRTGRSRSLAVVQAADGRAANPFESCLRAIALGIDGLTVAPQLAIPGIGHADLGDASLRLVLEAESFEFHALPEAFAYDLRRYNAMVRAGWTVLRFGWEDVMRRQSRVAELITDVVRRQRHAVRGCGSCPAA